MELGRGRRTDRSLLMVVDLADDYMLSEYKSIIYLTLGNKIGRQSTQMLSLHYTQTGRAYTFTNWKRLVKYYIISLFFSHKNDAVNHSTVDGVVVVVVVVVMVVVVGWTVHC